MFSKYVLNDEAYQELLALAQTYGTEILKMDCGDTLTDGEAGLRCIFPDKTYKSDDKNALSLVLRYEDQEFSGIFTGDISSAEEQYLVEHKKGWQRHILQGGASRLKIFQQSGFPNGTLTGDHNHFLWGKQPLWASG